MRHAIDRSKTVIANSVFANHAEPLTPAECPSISGDDSQLSLRRILAGCRFFAGDDVVFSSIADSAEHAGEGELVVYRIGNDCPSKLVADALARGAAGILTEQLLPCPLPQCIVGDMELALASIHAEQLGHPDQDLLTVGVIGSSGKTSTALLVSTLMRACGIRTAYQTDLGECDGVVQSTSSKSPPVNASLVQWLAEARDCESKAAIIELTTDDARHGHYDAIEFDLLIVTGSEACSGDYGPSGLQCMTDRLRSGGVVIAPAEDAKATRVIRDSGAKLITYGDRKGANVTARIVDQTGGMTTLLVTNQDTTAVMETSLCGAAMAANHAAAISVGLLIDQPLQEVVEKLSQLRSVPGRGQKLDSLDSATVVLDAGGTPDRVAMALRTYRAMKSPGRFWCVLAIDGTDSPEQLARYGSLIERYTDHAIVTSKANAKSTFLSASHAVLDGVEKCASFRLVADQQHTIDWAVSEARPGDTILLVSGERDQTAVEQRSDIERIKGWVESARKSSDDHDGADTGAVKLKIFG